MAPYISSRLRGKVRLAPSAHWDIFQNLEANTRSLQSATAQAHSSRPRPAVRGGAGFPAGWVSLVVDDLQPILRPAPDKGSVLDG